jgi:hypothetical protein
MAFFRVSSFVRAFCSTRNLLASKSAYIEKLAARKPLPVIPETDLEEAFIKGTSSYSTVNKQVLVLGVKK